MVVCTFLPYNKIEQVLAALFAGEDNHIYFKQACTGFGGTVRSHSDERTGHPHCKTIIPLSFQGTPGALAPRATPSRYEALSLTSS